MSGDAPQPAAPNRASPRAAGVPVSRLEPDSGGIRTVIDAGLAAADAACGVVVAEQDA